MSNPAEKEGGIINLTTSLFHLPLPEQPLSKLPMIRERNNTRLIVLLHCLVWILLIGFPYLFSSENRFSISDTMEHYWIPLLTHVFLFYINYLLLINRFLFSKKWLLYIVINIVIIFILVETRFELRHFFFKAPPPDFHPHRPPPRPLSFMLLTDFFVYTVPVVFAIALRSYTKWLSTERERTEAVTANLSSELEQLKYQLQPHFFFNSLNNIYSMVDISPEKAKAMIHSLGKLMRYLLHDANAPLVSLKQEVDFINRYIDLMEVRFSGNVTIERSLQDTDSQVQVAPLLFISIAENAFKHGVSATHPSYISFFLEVNDSHICFTVRNTSFPKSRADSSGSGIGLENLRKRLELLYKNHYLLTIKEENGQFLVRLILDKPSN